MFKINRLNDVKEENININYVTQESYNTSNKTKESFETLSFDIQGKQEEINYSFSFDLNCKLEELLKINKSIDFKDYLFKGETFLTINGITDTDPEFDITIDRWANNKFLINIKFSSNISNDYYSGIIEFIFNLDNYIR